MKRRMTIRQRLRAGVWEMTGGRCEWPGCDRSATELAHIHPRGMGHTGYRDTFDNVMAACDLHARVTDMEHPDAHDQWAGLMTSLSVNHIATTHDVRVMLADHVAAMRGRNGYNVAGMQSEIDGG